jgi:transposase
MYACLYARVCFGKDISSRTMVRVLRRHKLAPLRPRPIPAQGDARSQQRFLDTFRGRIRRALPGNRFLFIDACTVKREATMARTWARRGCRVEVQVYRSRDQLHVMGAMDVTGRQVHYMLVERVDADHVSRFLEALARFYRKDTLHVVLDNAPAHRAAKTEACVTELGGRVMLDFLPTYSPRLNPIEKFWALLRRRVTHNTYFSSMGAFGDAVKDFLATYTKPNARVRHLSALYFKKGPVPVSSI